MGFGFHFHHCLGEFVRAQVIAAVGVANDIDIRVWIIDQVEGSV